MRPWAVTLAGGTLVASLLLTYLVRRLALARGLLDVPNQRSSHEQPTPRGGGLAVVIATTTGISVLGLLHQLDLPLTLALAGGLLVAGVGMLDDHRPLPARARLIAHLAAAGWALWWLGGLPPLLLNTHLAVSGWGGYVLGALGIVWAINLFNFMDGIDGIAASEAIFIALGAAALGTLLGVSGGVSLAALLFAAACAGFLWWNWPPARIFLGDVGSGYLGYVIVVLAVAATRENPVALWVWLILGGAFFVDATVTLARRTARGEAVHQAHRSHAYQALARRFQSHRTVTVTIAMVNVVWLLPAAWFAARHPQLAVTVVLVAFAPLALLALLFGAGRSESADERRGAQTPRAVNPP
jgi:Fuc2NAc and GlcNAc transferase